MRGIEYYMPPPSVPQTAISKHILFSHNLELVLICPEIYRCHKFDENPSNTFQDTWLTMFRMHTWMITWTHKQYIMPLMRLR